METRNGKSGWRPEAAAAFWINRASKLLLLSFDKALRPFGFAMSYLPVLRALADGSALSQTKLAQIAAVEQPSMAETLTRMERDDLVERERNPQDRRGSLVSVKRQTRARLPRAMAALIECDRRAMAGLSDAEQVVLRDLLMRVVKNLDDGAIDLANAAPCEPGTAAARDDDGALDSPGRRSPAKPKEAP
jgi:MarR family transcriptional regulator, transcriptional regulator for hemolysin